MRNRWLKLPVFGAVALSMMLAGTVPAFAQYGRPYGDGYRGGYYADYAYNNGFRAGVREGERDARDRRPYGFKRDDAYEDADWGFRGGNKRAYRAEFRRGYEAGYANGYRRFARDWRWRDRRWDDRRW